MNDWVSRLREDSETLSKLNELREKYLAKTVHLNLRVDVDHVWEYTGKLKWIYVASGGYIVWEFEDGTRLNNGAIEDADLVIT